MQIRLATRADEPAIQHVISTVFEEYGWPWEAEDYHSDLYDIEENYFATGGFFWVAELDGVVVGTVALDLFPALPGESGIYLDEGLPRAAGADCSVERLYLLPEARGKGIGLALWKTLIEAARKANRKRLEVWSDKVLTDAHRLYEKSGAIRVGDRLCPSPDQSPEWGMALDL